jgi:hypothetical protein
MVPRRKKRKRKIKIGENHKYASDLRAKFFRPLVFLFVSMWNSTKFSYNLISKQTVP